MRCPPPRTRHPRVSFQLYLGQLDRTLSATSSTPSTTAWTPPTSPAATRPHQLDIVAHPGPHLDPPSASINEATITALAEAMIAALDESSPTAPPRHKRRTYLGLPPRPPGPGHHRQTVGNDYAIDDIYPHPHGQTDLPHPDRRLIQHLPQPGSALPRRSHRPRRPGRRLAARNQLPPPSCAPPSSGKRPHPVQVVHHAATLPITHLDWTTLDQPARHHALTAHSTTTATGLDLTTPPHATLSARLTPTPPHLDLPPPPPRQFGARFSSSARYVTSTRRW